MRNKGKSWNAFLNLLPPLHSLSSFLFLHYCHCSLLLLTSTGGWGWEWSLWSVQNSSLLPLWNSKCLAVFICFFLLLWKTCWDFFFPQSKAFREIVSKCEVLVAMYSILYRCKCPSTLTKPFPDELQLHDCLLMKCMWDFKQPQLKKTPYIIYFSLHQKQTFTPGSFFGESLYLALLLENAINSGSEFLWKRPVSFQLQQCSSWSSSAECVFFRVVVEGSPGFWSEWQAYAFCVSHFEE